MPEGDGKASSPHREQASSVRFFALDAFRGFAAIIVVCLHNHGHFRGLPSPAGGWLAVDLFFLLSGFVLAHAYSQRLGEGLTPLGFFKIRLIRLYPLYFFGLVIGVGELLITSRPWSSSASLRIFAEDAGLGFLMLPSPHTLGDAFDPIFPINLPAWSLFFEVVVNLVYCGLHRHLTTRRLSLLVLVSGVTLIVAATLHRSLELGNYWHTFFAGIPRVAFSFFSGVLLQRLPSRIPALGFGWFASLSVLLVCVLMFGPESPARLPFDLFCTLVLFPLLVLAGASIRVRDSLKPFCAMAGDTSYAVYILHFPLTGALIHHWSRLGPDVRESSLTGPVFIVGLLAGCYGVDRLYDRPIRRFLTSRLTRSTAA